MQPQHGMSHWFCHPYGGGTYRDMNMVRDGRLVKCSGYLTDVITDGALMFIEANREKRFYMSVNYTAPHSPWGDGEHPRDIVDSYDDCLFESCPQEEPHPWARGLTTSCHGNREMLKGYFAAVTALDAGVGRILAQLDRSGLRENTLVIFCSDNGFSCGHHGFWGKGNGTFPLNMYENSVKVPAIFSHGARIAAGRTTDAMVSQYDFMPTLLDYLGIAMPNAGFPLPGRSFLPVLEGRTDEAAGDVVVYDEYGPVRMIRTREWKYVHRYDCGLNELYDMMNDPDERRNLVDAKDRQNLIVELRNRLSNWFAEYVLPARDGVHAPVSGQGQLGPIGTELTGESAFQPRST
jgi:arylsulfatase A-like enzyme